MISRRSFVLGIVSAAPAFYIGGAFASKDSQIRQRLAKQSQFRTLQVQKGNEIVLSTSAYGYSFERMVNIKSCSKSLLGLLLGVAIEKKHIANVKLTLSEVIPDLLPKNVSPLVANISLEQLVTLTAPLQSTSGQNYGRWTHSTKWVDYVLSRPQANHQTGGMIYSTGATHVLGAAITKLTGQSLLELSRNYLGKPLGIEIPAWTKDPQGYYLGGNNMSLTPKAMLRIACLVRDRGKIDHQQIISDEWIAQSIKAHTISPWSGLGYGYGWFITDSGYVLARGYGGQIIAAHMEKDLAVVMTSDPNRPATSDGYFGELLALLDGPILALA